MDLGVAIRVYRLHWNCACILLLLGSSANNNCSKHSNMPSKNDNGSKKRGTATEHAKQPVTNGSKKRGTATEHAKQPVVLKPNAQTQQAMKLAQASRANNTFEHLLFLLADFLTMILRELWPRVAEKCEDVVFD